MWWRIAGWGGGLGGGGLTPDQPADFGKACRRADVTQPQRAASWWVERPSLSVTTNGVNKVRR